ATVVVQGASASMAGTNWEANAVNLDFEGPNLLEVRAANLAGDVNVQNLVIVRDTMALKPQGLSVAAVATSTNRLEWLDSGESDLVTMEIYRRFAGATNYTLVGNAMAHQTFFEDGPLPAGTNFCYRIRSRDDLGNLSPYSDEVCPVGFGGGFFG